MSSSKDIELPVEYLRECFLVEPSVGVLYWKERPLSHHKNEKYFKAWSSRFKGKPVGWLGKNGYLYVTLNNKKYLVHRIVWALSNGHWPPNEIDHIDVNRANNSISNLREVTREQNHMNRALINGPSRTNKTGCHGVTWHKKSGKWMAKIIYQNKSHYLGIFDDVEDAISARKAAEIQFGFHENHGTR
ncbi:HNH endonuclease [Citrobacter portucalensis]|uniref:HNH endonuclease n=1 Tax=Citrobacter portucalensis TaxID=1639133 RepID=UPI0039FBE827|nr:HNH endonuclease [Citrobacter freundii]